MFWEEVDSIDTTTNTNETKPVEVQIRRRETDKMKAARLKSYSHLKEIEQQEPWQNIEVFAEEVKKKKC